MLLPFVFIFIAIFVIVSLWMIIKKTADRKTERRGDDEKKPVIKEFTTRKK